MPGEWQSSANFVALARRSAFRRRLGCSAPLRARLSLPEIDDPLLKLALGVFIIFAMTWAKLPALANGGPAVMAAGGAGTTFLSMFFGATGPLTAAFFAKSFDDRRAYIASHAAAMTFQHALKVVAFVAAPALPSSSGCR